MPFENLLKAVKYIPGKINVPTFKEKMLCTVSWGSWTP